VAASWRLDPDPKSKGVIGPILYDPKIMVRNVRGLNSRARRLGVHSLVATTDASIVCMQEIKLANVTPAIVMETPVMDFDAYFCLPVDDTRGGIIVAWITRLVQLHSAHVDTNSVTAMVTPSRGSQVGG
jgi:exonuclease III